MTATQPGETFTVTYSGPQPVSVASIDSTDIVVTGPNGYSQPAQLVSVDNPADGTPRVATYKVTGPGGGSFTDLDNGSYSLNMQFQQVQNTVGDFVPEGTIGAFSVGIVGAELAAPPTFLAGTQKYFFDVTYRDPSAIKLASLNNSDILVTNTAAGFSQLAKKESAAPTSDGTVVTVTYSVTAPSGTWAAADTGNYTIALQAGEVTDSAKAAIPAATLGTVALTDFGGLTGPPAGELPSASAAVVAADATGKQYIAFFDSIAQDLKFLVRTKTGRFLPMQVIDASPVQVRSYHSHCREPPPQLPITIPPHMN